MINIPIRFNITNPSVAYNFPEMENKPKQDTIRAWVDSYYGSDEYGDGTKEKPWKTARKAYDESRSYGANTSSFPAIVLRGYFDIDFADDNVYWIGDDGNTVINYTTNQGKSGCYINLTVKGYFKRSNGQTFSHKANFNSERDTNGTAKFKNYYGVVDVRDYKPATEVFGGYWHCVLLSNRLTGGNYFCAYKGQVVNNTFGSDNLFFADCTYLVNNQDVSYLSERGNYSTDEAYTEYIKTQTGFDDTFVSTANTYVTRYTFDEVFVYDKENLSVSLTEVGNELAKKYREQLGWIKGNKNIPILSNSDGVKECFDNNTKWGGVDVEDNSLVLDETISSGGISTKVIKLNRATQAINGLVSGLRHYSSFLSTSYEIGRKHSGGMISIMTDADRTITSSEEGYYFIEEYSQAPANPKISYNGNQIDFVPNELFLFKEGDVLTRVSHFSYNLVSVVQPNRIVNFFIRGCNTIKSEVESGNLTSGCTYIALNGSATVNIGGTDRTLVEGESVDITSSTDSIVSGKLGLVFNSSDPWFIIDSNCDKFGIGLYSGYSGYEIPYVNSSKYKDIRGLDIYLTKSVKLPSRYDTRTSNGISFRYVQLKLSYTTTSTDQ